MVCEVKEWAACGPFLPHEEKGRVRCQAEQDGERTIGLCRNQMVQAFPPRTIAGLVMIRDAMEEALRRKKSRLRFPPEVIRIYGLLARKPSASQRQNELFDRSFVILKIRPTLLGLTDARRVMKAVGPYRVKSQTTLARRSNNPGFMAGILGDRVTAARVHRLRHFRKNVRLGIVLYFVSGVEAKAIDVELLHPVARISKKKLTNRCRHFRVEVESTPPRGMMPIRRVCQAERRRGNFRRARSGCTLRREARPFPARGQRRPACADRRAFRSNERERRVALHHSPNFDFPEKRQRA